MNHVQLLHTVWGQAATHHISSGRPSKHSSQTQKLFFFLACVVFSPRSSADALALWDSALSRRCSSRRSQSCAASGRRRGTTGASGRRRGCRAGRARSSAPPRGRRRPAWGRAVRASCPASRSAPAWSPRRTGPAVIIGIIECEQL